MPIPDKIPDQIRDLVLNSKSLAVWPLDEYPLSEPYRIAAYFQDHGFKLYPIHEFEERILEEQCYRDIRLVPDDYDLLLLFVNPDSLPEVTNAIFNADYMPKLVWMHVGIEDLFSYDRLMEAQIRAVMGRNLMDCYREWIGD